MEYYKNGCIFMIATAFFVCLHVCFFVCLLKSVNKSYNILVNFERDCERFPIVPFLRNTPHPKRRRHLIDRFSKFSLVAAVLK